MKSILLIFLSILIGSIRADGDKVGICSYNSVDNHLSLECSKTEELPNFFELANDQFTCRCTNTSELKKFPRAEVITIEFKKCKMITLPELRSFKYVQNLDASNMGLQNLRADSLEKLTRLKNLNLAKNELKTFDPNTFHNLGNLVAVDFSSNKLIEFDLKLLIASFYTLTKVNLNDNEIVHLVGAKRKWFRNLKLMTVNNNQLICKELKLYIEDNGWSKNLHVSLYHPTLYDIDEINREGPPVCIEIRKQSFVDKRRQSLGKIGAALKRTIKSWDKVASPENGRIGNCLYNSEKKSLELFCFKNASNKNFFDENTKDFTCRNLNVTIDRANVIAIKFINCEMNDLPSFRSFENLGVLDVSEMGLSTLSDAALQSMPNLLKLIAKKNRLSGAQNYTNLKNVQLLDLSENPINIIETKTPFSQMDSLVHLIIANAGITSIHINAFSKLPHLKTVNLSKNELIKFNLNVFWESRNVLTTIDLNENEIESLEKAHRKDYSMLTVLSLIENQIPCVDLEFHLEKYGWMNNLYPSNEFFSYYPSQINSLSRPVCINRSK